MPAIACRPRRLGLRRAICYDATSAQFYFDWRNRMVAAKAGVEGSEATSLNRPITYQELNNLGQVVAQEQYDGDGVTIVDAGNDGTPDKPSSTLLRARSTTEYDDLGRAFKSHVYSVDQSTGAVSIYSLTTDYFYDKRGNLIKTSAPGGVVAKTQYDGAGRTTKTFVTDGGGDTGWSDADDVLGDAVLEQAETQYDANGNVLLSIRKRRFHDETATGELGDVATGPKARVSYVASWYDLGDRPTATADVGTNGGSAYARPANPPARSDTTLVVDYLYNAAGWVETATDPRGIVAKTYYDNLGRTTKTIENYVDGTPSAGDDKTTEYAYDGANHVLTLKAVLPGGAAQITQNVYGVTTATGSNVNSNDLLAAVKHPDATTGQPSDAEKETYTVNALGQTRTFADRNGTVHTLSYDVLGRQTADAITTLGTGVDGAVRRIETSYDTAGRAYLFTSYDAATGGNIVNQVLREFNGLGQLLRDYQSHSGAVDTGTTLKVEYVWSEMAGGANHSRQTSVIYPNGRVVTFNYAAGLDDSISRLSSLSDSSDTLEALSYLGMGTVVKRSHPQNSIDLTYVKQTGEPNGDAGDQYTGLDRFDRIVDQRWLNSVTAEVVDRYKYAYDRDSNRVSKTNELNHSFDETYTYDSLNQLIAFTRADGHSQTWNYDALGNWNSVTTDGTPETREHNLQNELTKINSNTLTYDNNGNLKTDEQGKQFKYDAWNQQTEVRDAGNNLLSGYQYDSLNRRIVENSGTARDLYYSAEWQVVEERQSGLAVAQQVWSPVYVDAMILRDRDTNGDGSLDERLYALHDANFNVTALANTIGGIVERFTQEPFGKPTILTPTWTIRTASLYDWLYLHQGGRFEVISGLYDFRHRVYSPSLGRWMQADPIGYNDGPNLYAYLHQNPTNGTDPMGLYLFGSFSSQEQQRCVFWCGIFPCQKAHELAKHALARTEQLFPIESLYNGPGDAFRHCYWSCLMQQTTSLGGSFFTICRLGVNCAKKIGEIHEWRNRQEGQTQAEEDMDRHNNGVGLEVGAMGIDCEEGCLAKLNAGNLVRLI